MRKSGRPDLRWRITLTLIRPTAAQQARTGRVHNLWGGWYGAAPLPQPKSDLSDFGQLKCRTRVNPSSVGEVSHAAPSRHDNHGRTLNTHQAKLAYGSFTCAIRSPQRLCSRPS